MTPTKRTDSFIRKGVTVTVELDYLTDGKEYYVTAKMGNANIAKIKQAFRDAGLEDAYLKGYTPEQKELPKTNLPDALILVAGYFTEEIASEQRKEKPNYDYIELMREFRTSVIHARNLISFS